MRFKKDTWVEVAMPAGMWRPAMILSGNGRSYIVRCWWSGLEVSSEERIPRKALRPIPETMRSYANWVPGDIAEVLHEGSWKPAEVVKEVDSEDGTEFSVRLDGSPMQLSVPREHLRFRQLWQNDRWTLIPKDSRKRKVRSTGGQQNGAKISFEWPNNQEDFKDYVPDVCSSTTKKFSVILPSTRLCSMFTKKQRVMNRDEQFQFLVGKADATVYPSSAGENYMHSSLGNADGCLECPARQLANSSVLDNNDAESSSSSVGSCSPCSYPSVPTDYSLGCQSKTRGSSDIAECSLLGRVPSAKDVLDAETHLTELLAYRAMLVQLHAAGPISWEQEELITNLRFSLNISTDEHLAEVRNLLSSDPSR